MNNVKIPIDTPSSVVSVTRRDLLTSGAMGVALLLSGCGRANKISQHGNKIKQQSEDEEPLAEPDLPDFPDDSAESARAWKRRKPNGRRGIQAVFLSHWSKASCDTFIKVCQEAGSPAQIEIGFAPYIKDDTFYIDDQSPYALPNVPTSTGKYAQFETIRYIAEKLAAKSLVITVHFGFHARKGDPDTIILAARVADFYDKFFKDYQNKVQVVLSPSLEDNFISEADFKAYVQVIAENMKELGALTLGSGNVVSNMWVRRSQNNPGINQPYTYLLKSSFTNPDGKIVTPWKLKVRETEVHGPLSQQEKTHVASVLNQSNIKVYSNGGNFVWFDNPRSMNNLATETKDAADNADTADVVKYSLSDFVNQTYRSGKVVLLWRPAYNLFPKEKGTFQETPVISRHDSENAPKFDDTEAEALGLFFGSR